MPKLINKQNKNGVPNNPSTIPKNGTFTRKFTFCKLHEKEGKKAAWVISQNLNSKGQF